MISRPFISRGKRGAMSSSNVIIRSTHSRSVERLDHIILCIMYNLSITTIRFCLRNKSYLLHSLSCETFPDPEGLVKFEELDSPLPLVNLALKSLPLPLIFKFKLKYTAFNLFNDIYIYK